MLKLTPKQARFVEEYLIDLNATQAATRAGYSPRSAKEQGCLLLQRPHVHEALQAAQQARTQRTHITQDRVLQELGRVAFSDIRRLYRDDGTLKPPTELDDDAAAALASVEVFEEFQGRGEDRTMVGYTRKVKVFDKIGALGLAARHLGMLKDRTELTGPGGAALTVVVNKLT